MKIITLLAALLLAVTTVADAQTILPQNCPSQSTATVKLIAPDSITPHRGLTVLFRNGTYRGFYFGPGERIYFVGAGECSSKCGAENYNLEDDEELAAQIFFCDGTRSTIETRSNESDTSPFIFTLNGGDVLVFEIRPKSGATTARK